MLASVKEDELMPMLPTRTIKADVEVFVSRCAVCGEEELANVHGLAVCAPNGHPCSVTAPDARLRAQSWSFSTHVEVRFGAFNQESEWRFCSGCAEVMRRRLGEAVAEERARLS